MRMQATSGRGRHHILVTFKRFEQGLLLNYGSIPKPMFLSGSQFLPTEVLPPGLTSSSGAVTRNAGGRRSEGTK